MQNDNLVQTMKQKAEIVQAIVSNIDATERAFQYAVDLTQKQGGKTIATIGFSPDEETAIRQICESADIAFLEKPLRNHANDIHTSLTPANFGIAATGSLVFESSSEDMRIATMLAETHVAVLPADRIRPDAFALEREIGDYLKNPAYYAFVTGASRTADIERVLAIGVHGPQELHILIVGEEEKE